MKQAIYILISICIVTITFSCSPQKRLSRLVKNNPELSITDTIKIKDTVITSKTSIDTAFHKSIIKDTLIITKEKLRLQIVEIRDTIYIEVEHDADTIVIEREIPVERIIIQKQEKDSIQSFDDLLNKKWFWVLIGVVSVLIILRLLFPRKQSHFNSFYSKK